MAHPDLTGMPRQQLLDLTAELHHQPSTDPAPTPRGRGPQLTFQEQVWATVLSRRRLTHQLLAKTFGVSPATIKRAIARTGPRLHQHGTTITPLPKPIRHTVTLSRYYISETLGNDPQHA
jgi:hypothetical protein